MDTANISRKSFLSQELLTRSATLLMKYITECLARKITSRKDVYHPLSPDDIVFIKGTSEGYTLAGSSFFVLGRNTEREPLWNNKPQKTPEGALVIFLKKVYTLGGCTIQYQRCIGSDGRKEVFLFHLVIGADNHLEVKNFLPML